jgi:hypothetical protein
MFETKIIEETLDCPHCGSAHFDIDEWALKPHKTHLCLHCHLTFEGSLKAVSRPTFKRLARPSNICYETLGNPYVTTHYTDGYE